MEQLTYRKAGPADLAAVLELYDKIIDGPTNYTGWARGYYPTEDVARAGIDRGETWLVYLGAALVATLTLNSRQPEAFLEGRWKVNCLPEQVMVIHTFMVDPAFGGRGIGRACMDFARQQAEEAGMRALRLDVYVSNPPAIKLYEQTCGYHYCGTVDLLKAGPAVRIKWFRLYELAL